MELRQGKQASKQTSVYLSPPPPSLSCPLLLSPATHSSHSQGRKKGGLIEWLINWLILHFWKLDWVFFYFIYFFSQFNSNRSYLALVLSPVQSSIYPIQLMAMLIMFNDKSIGPLGPAGWQKPRSRPQISILEKGREEKGRELTHAGYICHAFRIAFFFFFFIFTHLNSSRSITADLIAVSAVLI